MMFVNLKLVNKKKDAAENLHLYRCSVLFFLQLPKIEHDIEPDYGFVSTMIWEFTMYMLCFNLDMSDQ